MKLFFVKNFVLKIDNYEVCIICEENCSALLRNYSVVVNFYCKIVTGLLNGTSFGEL